MATNFFIHQNIVIHQVKIGGITNSSVFQIGSAGVIKSLSNLYNTGGFIEPAPTATHEILQEVEAEISETAPVFVPLAGISP